MTQHLHEGFFFIEFIFICLQQLTEQPREREREREREGESPDGTDSHHFTFTPSVAHTSALCVFWLHVYVRLLLNLGEWKTLTVCVQCVRVSACVF